MRALIYLRVSTKEQAERDHTEEGFSIPAQREACARHIESLGCAVVGEYVDRGESARSAHRPQLQAMLSRIVDEGDVDTVIVHKVDRLARNLEDHVAIQAQFKRHGVRLVSVTENLEESASGKLVEGIHALMAEFYSANLASEIKKGLNQKAKMGGWPHKAPIGYRNVRETIGGRQIAHIVVDDIKGPLIAAAFELYASGEWTLERLHTELVHRGLRGSTNKPISLSTLSRTLTNKAYMGIVEWNGVENKGLHQALVSHATFDKVQELLTARAMRGTRERKHNHYLKGSLRCGVCNRQLCTQLSKGTYLYFFCLGQKNKRHGTGCQEKYVSSDLVANHVEALYQRIELPQSWLDQLRIDITTEIAERTTRSSNERKTLDAQLATARAEKHKLMNAYYAGAIDVDFLKIEQSRVTMDIAVAESRLANLGSEAEQWQAIIEKAMTFAAKCGAAYKQASDRGRRTLNKAVFESIEVRDGKVAEVKFHAPFDLLFSREKFEYERFVEMRGIEPLASALRTLRSTN